MRIERIETIPVRVPINPQLAIRSGRGGTHLESPFLLVRIYTDDGIVGVGEVSCTPRWSGEDQVTAAHFIDKYFAPLLVGEAMDSPQQLSENCAPIVARNSFTKAAVEMALWDIAGRAHGKPVFELLGGRRRERVSTKWSVSGVEPAKAAHIANWAVSQGFFAMKIKVGTSPDEDLARVRAVRDVVGPRVRLGVDANGGWPAPDVAVEAIARLCEQCDIYFAEQPVAPGDHDALADVRRRVPVPIIADESIWTLDDAKLLARTQAADVFSIYVGKAGGIGPAREIVRFAESVGIKCTIGSNLELGVGTAAMIHLALSAPGLDSDNYPCDIIGPLYYDDDVLREPLPVAGGSVSVNDKPGLGVELDDEKIERYRVR